MKTPLLAALLTALAFTGAQGDSPTTNAAPPPPVTNSVVILKTPTSTMTIPDEDDDGDTTPKHHGSTLIINAHGSGGGKDSMWGDLLIPIIAIVVPIVTPLLMVVMVVFFVSYFRYKRRAAQLTLAREYLAKGLPVPPQLLDESQRDYRGAVQGLSSLRPTGNRDLRKGLILASVGFGLAIALYINSPHSTMWGWGFIPAVLGIGLIISGVMQSRDERRDQPATPPNQPPEPPR